MAEDKSIRQFCLAGVPYGHYFTLESRIRCPKCSGMITLAPCVACDAPSAVAPRWPTMCRTRAINDRRSRRLVRGGVPLS